MSFYLNQKNRTYFSQENLFNTFFKAKDAAFDLLMLSGNIKLLSQLERFKRYGKEAFSLQRRLWI